MVRLADPRADEIETLLQRIRNAVANAGAWPLLSTVARRRRLWLQ